MKLHNPTARYVFLRDELNHQLITLKPEEIIDVRPEQRQIFSKYVEAFQLRWLLDEKELPQGVSGEETYGTYSHFKKHEDDILFDATKALAQSDATEVADIWKHHDTLSLVPHEALRKGTADSSSNFLFPQEVTEQEERIVQETTVLSDTELRTLLKDTDAIDDTSPLSENASSPDGPDYLRQSSPVGLEGFGTDTEVEIGDEETRLPDDAPVTISELTLGTKSQLWERADKLGLDANGSKKQLIDRICKYYWEVHYTNMRVMNREK